MTKKKTSHKAPSAKIIYIKIYKGDFIAFFRF